MRRIIAVLITAVLTVALSVSAFATPGAFVESISGVPTPGVVDCDTDECDITFVVVPYSERHKLGEEDRGIFEDAYNTLVSVDNVKELNGDVAELAEDKTVAVSDFFDVTINDCGHEEGYHNFDVVLSVDTLENFVALIQYGEDGTWSVVDNAKVTDDGKNLQFNIDYLTPLAIVVNTENDAPQTNDDSLVGLYLTIMAASAAGLVVVLAVAHNGKKKQGA